MKYPIVLFCYNRPEHTLKVLQALQVNELADQSTLYIYVDGPKENSTVDNIQKIEEVRKIVVKEKWCKEVIFHISNKNIGCRNSIINGISEVLNHHEAVIILEDDIVTSPEFLNYMNLCLNYYINFKSVFSISALNLPENKISIPKDYNYDVYVSLRQLNSGWGTWRDRWSLIDWNLDNVKKLFKDKIISKSYARGGDDLIPMLWDEIEGRSDAWDVQFTLNQFKYHAVSIIPRFSYVDNIGGDGSGTHHLDNNTNLRFDLNKSLKNPRLLDVIYEDSRIINAFYNAFCSKKRPIWKKIINRLSRMMGGKNVFVIKKKIYA